MNMKEEPIYEENPTITVRPGKKLKPSRVPKVSVAIDATPATRTESVLNQIPIELGHSDGEPYVNRLDDLKQETPDSSSVLTAPQVVVIEHHHSKSDPLPMDSVFRNQKPVTFSSQKICESDSGSTSSLYAKVNPKLKSRLPRIGSPQSSSEVSVSSKKPGSENLYDQVSTEEIYGLQSAPKLTTFGGKLKGDDINVTCREPTEERDSISPEEALKTIKRRKYPKVLPDIEKRRSLPAPNSLFIPKQYGNSLKDYKNNSPLGQNLPPLPPPRVFGTSKSLDLAEERESQFEPEPITTNLHVGPLLKRQDSTVRNNSDPNLIETLKRKEDQPRIKSPMNQSQSSGNISSHVHGTALNAMELRQDDTAQVSALSLNDPCKVALGAGNPNWYRPKRSNSKLKAQSSGSSGQVPDMTIGNPNWYKPLVTATCSRSDGDISPAVITIPNVKETQVTVLGEGKPNSGNSLGTLSNNCQQSWESKGPAEPKIVITPRVGNLLGQSGQSLSHTLSNMKSGRYLEESQDKKEPKIIITPNSSKNLMKQPKIIIKPSTNPCKVRDNKNIPKVSAIPSPECQNIRNTEKDKSFERDQAVGVGDKPPIKEKPKVTRIPSFSKRKEENAWSPVYAEKAEIVQKVEAVAIDEVTDIFLTPNNGENKSGIPMILKKNNEKSSSTDSSNSTGNSNTGTIKRKPK